MKEFILSTDGNRIMFRKLLSVTGRLALLLVIALAVFGYLVSGLDEGDSASAARDYRNAGPVKLTSAKPLPQPATQASASQAPVAKRSELSEALGSIDRCFEERWAKDDIEIAPPADWLTVSRRLSLALVGAGMSLQEIRELEGRPESQRVDLYLEQLLRDPRHHDYWAERFTRVYVGAEDGPFIAFRRRRFRLWLSDAFAANQPYDKLVRSLVTAEGLSTDRPEVNFLTVTQNSNKEGELDPIRLAAKTSRAFIGLRIDCMQCHDDFLGNVSLGDRDALRDGTQKDFHSLAAFYASAQVNGLQGVRTDARDYEYQFLNDDKTSTVDPKVPYGAHLLPKDGKPRERLAVWLTHPENKQAARATVNRVWALMFGRPMTASVDNIPLNAEVHPAMDALADDFVKHGFDLRRLIRLIAYSRPFGLDSEADFEITEQHEQQWSVFPLVRLRPEQVAGSVIQAARVKTVDRDSSLIIQLMKFGGVNDFVTRYGDIGEDELNQDNVTITQRLIMLNGELVREYGSANPALNATSHISMFSRNDEDIVETTYLCVLNRFPDDDEKLIFVKRLADSKDRVATIEDLYWVLLNSSELAWNH